MITIALKLITPPAAEPVTLVEAKAHLRVDDTSEDVLITALITAAREYCEGFQSRAYITQVYDLWLDDWPAKDYITIPRPPLQSVTTVKYYGTDDTEYTLAATEYFVDDKSEPGRLALAYNKSWPTTTLRPTNAVVVRFTAGYGNAAANVPQRAKQAMLLLVGHWSEHREAVMIGNISASKEIEFAVNALLWQDRVVPV